MFFGREISVPLDVVYGSLQPVDAKLSSFNDFKRNINHLYEIAREKMSTRQNYAATYYDQKVIDDKLNVGDLVYMYLPRNKRVKLAMKWTGVEVR